MNQFNTIFNYFPQYCVTVCKECGSGVIPAHWKTHLDNKHAYLTAKTRKNITQAASQIQGLAEREEDVIYPDPTSDPVPHLPVWHNGFKCTAAKPDGSPCRYIRRTLEDIQKHCRKEHGWKNTRKRGRPSKGRQPEVIKMWVEGVHCQQFFKTGGFQRLFEVEARKEIDVNEEEEEGLIKRQLAATFETVTEELEKADKEANSAVQPDDNRHVPNAWLNRTGWAKHFAGLDREWLLELNRRSKRREKALAKICWAVEMVIWKAQQASCAKVVGFPAMNYVNRREMGNDTNEKPLNARQKGSTMVKYSNVWTGLVGYIWRSYQLEEIKPEEVEEEGQESSGRGDREGSGGSSNEKDGAPKGIRGKRPRYKLTIRQVKRLWQIKQVVDEDEEEEDEEGENSEDSEDDELEDEEEEILEKHVLEFLLSLLDHNLKDDEYKSVLVSAAAVFGVSNDCGWKSALSYTPTISAIVTVARMLVLYKASKARKERVAEIMEKEGFSKEDADEQAPSHFDLVKEMANGFMTLTSYGGNPSPMDWLLRLRTYGMKIRFTTNADGVVEWVGDTLLYGHIKFSMAGLRSMIHGLVETTRMELRKELLLLDVDEDGRVADGATQVPVIEWDSLVDNPAEMRSGWNFFKDKRNTFGGVEGEDWLSSRVVQERKLREAFVDVRATDTTVAGRRRVVWKANRVRTYDKAIRLFREHLLVLAHMTGGLPARGTEVVTVQHVNSANGECRGVFIEDGLMVYVTMYHKGIGASGKAKIIHRYLPREVGELFFYYLWLVIPFWRKLESAAGEARTKETSAFIWEPVKEEQWMGPRRRKRRQPESTESDKGDGQEGDVVEGSNNEEEREGRVEGNEDLGGMEKYTLKAVEKWDTNRVRRAIQRVSLQWLGVKMTIMAWRHGSKAIYRRYINDKAVIRAFVEGDEDQDGEDEAFDIQTGHGSRVGGGIYGRPITESPFSTEAQRAGLRRVSIEWHGFLLFKSTLEVRAKKGTRAAQARREAIEEEIRRWRRMRLVDVQEQLEALIGKGAQFRDVQRVAIEAIMRQKSPVVVVMGTGAGKSMLFILPASCSTGVTVVVVPLISLRGDIKRRCEKAGIECVEWDSRKPHEWASVVLVTPESAVSESFGNFMNRQRAMGRLERIVIDECHVVLDSTSGWRTRILGLRDLVKAETQLVYLTATMRPGEQGEFIRLMGLPAKEKCYWFQGITTRKNVAYQVRMYDVKEEEEVVGKLVEEKKVKYPMPGQIIVYCDTVEKTERLATVLGCVCYHRRVGSRAEKSELVRQLTEGLQQVFTATNALGLGVDAPTIRAVIHVGVVRKIRDYAQESGRAGRDGLKSEAIILRGVRYNRAGSVQEGDLSREIDGDMREFITTSGCMRVVLDRAMDGREDRIGCEFGEEKCDGCQGRNGLQESDFDAEGINVDGEIERELMEEETRELEQEVERRRIMAVGEMQLQSEEMISVMGLEERLEQWVIGCQWCRVWGLRCSDHDIKNCKKSSVDNIREGISKFKSMVKWERFSCCFDCGIPQEICASWDIKADTGGWRRVVGGRCQFQDVIVESIISIWGRWPEEFGGWVEKGMVKDGIVVVSDIEFKDMVVWLGRKIRWGGLESTKICKVFVEFLLDIGI